jgi:hypothetical protein
LILIVVNVCCCLASSRGEYVAHPPEEQDRISDPPDEEYHDPEEMGPLGEPLEEETPQGTFLLLALFLIALVVMWFLVYYQLWLRG